MFLYPIKLFSIKIFLKTSYIIHYIQFTPHDVMKCARFFFATLNNTYFTWSLNLIKRMLNNPKLILIIFHYPCIANLKFISFVKYKLYRPRNAYFCKVFSFMK